MDPSHNKVSTISTDSSFTILFLSIALRHRSLDLEPWSDRTSWPSFLNFRRRTLNKWRKPRKVTAKSQKHYTSVPSAQEKSKVDGQIESGEYLGTPTKERVTGVQQPRSSARGMRSSGRYKKKNKHHRQEYTSRQGKVCEVSSKMTVCE